MEIIKNQYLLFNKFNDNIIKFIEQHHIMVYCSINFNNIEIILNEIKEYELSNIIWKYDLNNIRLPYNNNNIINYYKLKESDNIYNFISSNLLIDYKQIITGEKIQKIADIVVGEPESINWNPNNIFYSKSISTINNLNSIESYNTIFVFTHDLEKFYNKFENKISNKIIISHNSDHEILSTKNIKLHLAQNCLIKNDKLISIPIGIENNQWFDHNIFNDVRNMKIKKTKNIYFFFNLGTHESRIKCYNALNNKLEWNTKKNKKEYFIELSLHKYAICPRGNGIDTHRIYECLYLDVIPIIIKKDYPNIDNLPLIILNEWNEIDNITNEFINQQNSKLTIDYYYNIINI